MTALVANWIDGRESIGRGAALELVNPATEAPVGLLSEADVQQVGQAVRVARNAFDDGRWAGRPVAERRRVLRAAAEGVRREADRLVALQVEEGGMIPAQVAGQIGAAAGWFEYFADFLTTVEGQVFRQTPGASVLVDREPIGVCALFSPWNVPVALSAIKLAPALAAGNSVVLKPSEFTPRSTRLLVDIVHAAGVPDGVLNCVNGRGAVTGAALAGHPGVDMVAFTGGPGAGRLVAEAAARRHAPCVMELGGKSATIVFDDADVEAALAGALRAIYGSNGEACLAGSRILLQESIAERFIEAFAARACAMKVGDPLKPGVEIGPMISRQHRDRIMGYCRDAPAQGDRLLFGGDSVAGLEKGYFVQPAGVLVTSESSRVWREEIFGPVAAFRTFRDEAEAILLANDSEHGLAGYVWTQSLDRAFRVSRAIRAGSIIVNQSFVREPNAPFGGFKASGVGREGGAWSFANFTEAKTTVICHG